MVKKCSKCGTENKDEASYCQSCGNSLVPAKPVPTVKVVTPIAPGAVPGVAVGFPPTMVRVTPPGMCFYHTNLRATYVCNRDGRAICKDCAKVYQDLVLCPQCYREMVPVQPEAPPARSATPMILSLIGGILVLACSLGTLLSPAFQAFAIIMFLLTDIQIGWVIMIGVLAGFGTIAGALVSYQQGYETIGGIIVILFSIVGLLAGGGFIVGFMLGLIGGALALTTR